MTEIKKCYNCKQLFDIEDLHISDDFDGLVCEDCFFLYLNKDEDERIITETYYPY